MTDHQDTSRIAIYERLLELSGEMSAVLDLDTLLERIQEVAIEVLDCERVAIFVYDEEREELRTRLSTGLEEIRMPVGKGIVGEAIRRKEVINVSDPYSDPRFYPEVDRATGFRTRNLLAFPMTGHSGEVVGALEVVNKRGSGFTDLDEELALILSSLTGIALQRQFLLQEYSEKEKILNALSVARSIQQSFLPGRRPELEGFEIDGWNQPAEATGGDYFDFIELSKGRLGVALGDVTGHGIGPALLMSECRALMRATTSMEKSPAQVMGQVNRLLYEDLGRARFITLCFAILEANQSEVEYVSAGQAPLILYSGDKRTGRFLDATTMPLGILPDLKFTSSRLRMEPRDIFLLVTDGFFEWANSQGEEFGKERVLDFLKRNSGEDITSLIEDLYAEVKEFSEETPQADDLTGVVVRKT